MYYVHTRMNCNEQNMYNVCACIYNAHTCFNQLSQQVFRGQHRDAELRDIPQPSHAREDEDGGSPCPEDGDFFYARPDAEETEEAINKFISGLESQEQSCYDSLHTLLSRLPVPVAPQQNVACCTRGLASRWAPVTLQQRMAGVAAMCMR